MINLQFTKFRKIRPALEIEISLKSCEDRGCDQSKHYVEMFGTSI